MEDDDLWCHDCGLIFGPEDFMGRCPDCDSTSVGNLKEEMEEADRLYREYGYDD